MRRKEERSKQGQTNDKAKQHSTPKAVTFPKKNELPRVGLEPTTLHVHVYVDDCVVSTRLKEFLCTGLRMEPRVCYNV